ncbi:hypothetical protein CPB86DRAFT_452309 [Serendipita vermifera]|nr:hypothetical protein CPB86DRAFT_452309 [Serendipita vermifera]
MSNSDPQQCISCKQPWDVVTRARRPSKTTAGPKGSLLPRCESCHSTFYKKVDAIHRQCVNRLLEPPSKVVSVVAFEEELCQLAKQDVWTQFSVAIHDIWKGDDEQMRPVSSRIIALIHVHTGYKFIAACLNPSKDILTTSLLIYCIQRDTAQSAAKRLIPDVHKPKGSAQMEKFPCQGSGKLVFDRKSLQVFLYMSHQSRHPPYTNISIPKKWTEYISERQDWDSDNVPGVPLV